MGNELVTVDFHGATLIGMRGETPADTMIAMKPVVEGMGLTWQSQHRKLMEHPVLGQGVIELMIPSNGGPQAMTALPLSRLNFWLATIQPNKVPDPAIRVKVIAYQNECADVLFSHFFAKTTDSTDGPGAPQTLVDCLKLVKQAKAVLGIRGAEAMWRALPALPPLPALAAMPEPLIDPVSPEWKRQGKLKPHQRFSQSEAEMIRADYRVGGGTIRSLAVKYNTTKHVIWRITSGKAYRSNAT